MIGLGDKVVCVQPGSSLLLLGHVYAVIDKTDDGLIEVDGCRGYLFGTWRFEHKECACGILRP